MMKQTIVTTIGIITAVISSHAASISFSNFNSEPGFDTYLPAVDSSGALLPDGGGFAAVGYFTFSDTQISETNAFTFANLKADFQEFGQLDFGGAGAFNAAGFFKGELSNDILGGSSFIGRNIFAVIGNGDTLATSDELAILRSDLTFEEDNPLFSLVFDLSVSSDTLLFGQVGPLTDTAAGVQQSTLQTLAPVPEPSTYAALAGCFALAWVMVRRRA